MKKQLFNKMILLLSLIFVAGAITGCRSKQQAPDYSAHGTEVAIPCSDNDYFTDATHFRGTGMAEGTNLASTRRRANLDANSSLAASINSTIRAVTDRYTQDITVGDANEFAERFEDMTRQVVNQVLNNVSITCNQVFERGGQYSVYMAVEVDKDELLNNISSRISRDDRLRLDYDRMQFERIFNEEMERLEQERP